MTAIFRPKRGSTPAACLPAGVRLLGLAVLLLVLGGCAAVAPVVGMTAAGVSTGAQYNRASRAEKTFPTAYHPVLAMAKQSLADLRITIQGYEDIDYGVRIQGLTPEAEVEVDVWSITPMLTAVKVTVGNSILDRDRATAACVVDYIGEGLAKAEAQPQAPLEAQAAEPDPEEGFSITDADGAPVPDFQLYPQ